jgi:hypothetical protein
MEARQGVRAAGTARTNLHHGGTEKTGFEIGRAANHLWTKNDMFPRDAFVKMYYFAIEFVVAVRYIMA